jgi:hypothetical protein
MPVSLDDLYQSSIESYLTKIVQLRESAPVHQPPVSFS